MNKQPLFSVGEEVILCSVNCPELNGEYTVINVYKEGDIATCQITGKSFIANGSESGFGYSLYPPNLCDIRGLEALFDQTALRKKYPPSTESFKEMMSNLTKVTMSNRQ